MHLFTFEATLESGEVVNGLLENDISIPDALDYVNKLHEDAISVTIRKIEKTKHDELQAFRTRSRKDQEEV